jgi:mannose-6-phosphate isomerase-like protein (cupin superfamily)
MHAVDLRIAPGTTLHLISRSEGLLVVEARYAGPGVPPPAHFHPHQDERFEVLEGAMRTRIGGQDADHSADAAFDVPRGTPHQMWNPHEEEALLRWSTSPAGRTLDWFRELACVLDGTATEDPASLLQRFADVFRLADA